MAQLNDLLVLGKSNFKEAMRIHNRVTSYYAEGPRFIANDGTNTVWFGINSSGTAWGLYNVVADKYILSDNGTSTKINNPLSAVNILPQTNNTYNIGSSSLKWANVYAHTGISVSDSSKDEFYISGGGSIQSRITSSTASWARSYSWKQRSDSSADFTTICQMGAYGDVATLKYWYVGTGYASENTWLQANASHFLTKVPVRLTKGHLYLEGANEGSSSASTTQLVFGTSSNNHIVISSNKGALVINPSTTATTPQIVLYLNSQSTFPGGINATADSVFGNNLTVTKALTVGSTGSFGGAITVQGALNLQNKSLTSGTFPSTSAGRYITWTDVNGNVISRLYGYISSSEFNGLRMYAYKPGTTDTSAYLYVQYGKTADDSDTKAGSNVKFYGAVWNDYAEFRKFKGEGKIPYGHIVVENGDDSLSLTTTRMQKGCNVCSDTFGFAIGETEENKMPIAVAGRSLVYTYEDRYSYSPGDAVCSAPGGTVSKMTRQEIKDYPDCIIGYVSAIPDYEIWGKENTVVDGRIWIKVI